MADVTIIDSGASNIGSTSEAFRFLGFSVSIAETAEDLKSVNRLVLPGVGSFFRSIQALSRTGITEEINRISESTPVLGICLGMQLLAEVGNEGGRSPGLALFPGEVVPLTAGIGQTSRLHVGFSKVQSAPGSALFSGLPDNADFYFVHEYCVKENSDLTWKLGFTEHNDVFLSAFERENVFGVQFHPEKSQSNGLELLRNFMGV